MTKQLSGKFVLRVDPDLHAELKYAAREANMSLNEYCCLRLKSYSKSDSMRLVQPLLKQATDIVGAALLGLVVFGSWARGEEHSASDIDVLVVVDAQTQLAPRFYHQWDQNPLKWSGHIVEPQFVQIPPQDKVQAGIWAEVALDGIVLFEKNFALSRKLAQIRNQIVSGLIERKIVHGQSYWVIKGVA